MIGSNLHSGCNNCSDRGGDDFHRVLVDRVDKNSVKMRNWVMLINVNLIKHLLKDEL